MLLHKLSPYKRRIGRFFHQLIISVFAKETLWLRINSWYWSNNLLDPQRPLFLQAYLLLS